MAAKIIIVFLAGVAAGVVAMLASAAAVRSAARGRTYADAAIVPPRAVGVVLGCGPRLANGRQNLYFRYRIEAAVALFQAGKVEYLLVSGDNHRRGYDEPTEMKDSLVRAGVPADRIVCDYAGFRTLDSIVRAREVFGQTRVTVISQEFHNQRAIYLARHRGLDAIGFNARAVGGRSEWRTACREQLARVRTLLDVYVLRTKPRFLGPKVPIGPAGDGVA